MPSRAAARAGLVTTASLSVALLTGLPAFAIEDGPTLAVGQPCPPEVTAEDLETLGRYCSEGIIQPIVVETPTSAPVEPTAPPETTPPEQPPAENPPPADNGVPAPPPPDVTTPLPGGPPPGATPPVGETPTGTDQPVAVGDNGGTPGAEDDGKDPVTPPGTSIRAAATTLDPASTSKSLLVAATSANLAVSDVPSLAAMRSISVIPGGKPLSAYTPLPLLATPTAAALASVQAPLLAVGDEAAAGGGFTLAGLSSEALPGLLVVLATALVASVGAGNLRVWQDRYAAARRR